MGAEQRERDSSAKLIPISKTAAKKALRIYSDSLQSVPRLNKKMEEFGGDEFFRSIKIFEGHHAETIPDFDELDYHMGALSFRLAIEEEARARGDEVPKITLEDEKVFRMDQTFSEDTTSVRIKSEELLKEHPYDPSQGTLVEYVLAFLEPDLIEQFAHVGTRIRAEIDRRRITLNEVEPHLLEVFSGYFLAMTKIDGSTMSMIMGMSDAHYLYQAHYDRTELERMIQDEPEI